MADEETGEEKMIDSKERREPAREKEVLQRELEDRQRTIARLEEALAGREAELAALRESLASAGEKLAGVNDDLSRTVDSYKSLVIESHPGVPAEMISGTTVSEVNQSLNQARALVEKVRQGMETEAAQSRIPFGAPPRAPLDISALTSREKIQYAIGGKR